MSSCRQRSGPSGSQAPLPTWCGCALALPPAPTGEPVAPPPGEREAAGGLGGEEPKRSEAGRPAMAPGRGADGGDETRLGGTAADDCSGQHSWMTGDAQLTNSMPSDAKGAANF